MVKYLLNICPWEKEDNLLGFNFRQQEEFKSEGNKENEKNK